MQNLVIYQVKSTPRIALLQQTRSLTHLLAPLPLHYSSNQGRGGGNEQQLNRNSSLPHSENCPCPILSNSHSLAQLKQKEIVQTFPSPSLKSMPNSEISSDSSGKHQPTKKTPTESRASHRAYGFECPSKRSPSGAPYRPFHLGGKRFHQNVPPFYASQLCPAYASTPTMGGLYMFFR